MTLKIGIIGCGHIGTFHARNLRDLSTREGMAVSYDGVCDHELGRAEAFARIAGCNLATTEPTQLIEHCDAVYVCTETAEHPALVAAAAQAGKHIFCEKPLATNLAQAELMANAVANAGVTHQVGLVLRHSPVFRVLEDLIQDQDLGQLLTAHMRDDQFFPVRGSYGSTWRGDVARAGGGALLEHSIHDVDLFRRLFGEVAAVSCHSRNVTGHPGIEDLAMVTFRHAGGHHTTLSSIWHSIDSRESSRSLEIFFERGRFTTEHDYFGSVTYQLNDQPPVTLSSEEVLMRFMTLERLDPRAEDLRSLAALSDRRFLEAVTAGTPAVPDFHTAVASHRVVDACYRSAAAGTEIALTS